MEINTSHLEKKTNPEIRGGLKGLNVLYWKLYAVKKLALSVHQL